MVYRVRGRSRWLVTAYVARFASYGRCSRSDERVHDGPGPTENTLCASRGRWARPNCTPLSVTGDRRDASRPRTETR